MPPKEKIRNEMSSRLAFAQRFKKLANAIHAAPDFRTVLTGLQEGSRFIVKSTGYGGCRAIR